MLTQEIIKKINEFVYKKPRTIQEIALLVKKNWKTADRYVERIKNEYGTINTRTFREGTRGALKIVYWSNIESIHHSEIQERLYHQITNSKRKEDFSPFDIYQYINEKMRRAFIEEYNTGLFSKKIFDILLNAEKRVLIFSGNISWINLNENKHKMNSIIERLIERAVPIKVLSRVDIASMKNISKLKEIDEKLGKDFIEIRHCEQPLRGFIIDGKYAILKEEKIPSRYKKGELEKPIMIFYEIFDEEWVEWLEKVFWSLFRISVHAKKRLEDIKTIRKLF